MGNTNLKNKLYSTYFFVIIWKWKATEVDKRKQNFCMALQKINLVGHITCMCHIIMHKSLCTTPVVHCNSISIVYGFKCLESANTTKIDEYILYLRQLWQRSVIRVNPAHLDADSTNFLPCINKNLYILNS